MCYALNPKPCRYFHDSRKPLVLKATMKRAGQCPLGLSSEATQGGMFRVRRRLLGEEGEGEREVVAREGGAQTELTAITCAHIEVLHGWLLYGCCMAAVWLLYGCCMVAVWLLYGCCSVAVKLL